MKSNKQESVNRRKELNAKIEQRKSKGQDNRKVHDTKGKNIHGRTPPRGQS
jgi:hypothetical protein